MAFTKNGGMLTELEELEAPPTQKSTDQRTCRKADSQSVASFV